MKTCGDIWENTDDSVHECILPLEAFGAHAMHRSATHTWAEVYDSEQETFDAVPISRICDECEAEVPREAHAWHCIYHPDTEPDSQETPIFEALARQYSGIILLAAWECELLSYPNVGERDLECNHSGHFGPLYK